MGEAKMRVEAIVDAMPYEDAVALTGREFSLDRMRGMPGDPGPGAPTHASTSHGWLTRGRLLPSRTFKQDENGKPTYVPHTRLRKEMADFFSRVVGR